MNLQWRSRRVRALVLAVVVGGMLAGCASTPSDPGARDPYDPLEPLNRQVFAFNRTADRFVVRPVARGYDAVMPNPVKSGVTNFFDNMATPVWALNHLLQGNILEFSKQTGRFVLNTTVGFLGLWDFAVETGLEKNRARFDTTFGKWGIPSGPFLMVPFLGPSSVRGAAGIYARFETDIIWNYFDDRRSIRDKLAILEAIDVRRRLLPLDRTMDQAPDPYIFIRDAYRQQAEYAVRGPPAQDDDIGLDFEDEDWGDDEG